MKNLNPIISIKETPIQGGLHKFKLLKKLRLTLILAFSLTAFSTATFSQITVNEINLNKKHHYILHNVNDLDSKKLYIMALSSLTLDKYRLIKKRRIIEFDTGVYVELLSSEELFKKYKKPISPLALKKEKPIKFYIKESDATIIVKTK